MSVENDLKSLLPYLNQLERELNRDQLPPTRPNTGVNNPQEMYRNIKRMVDDMEQKLADIPTSTSRVSPHLSRTMPNLVQPRPQVNSNLRVLANHLRDQLDSICPRREMSPRHSVEQFNNREENNLSLHQEVEYGQGEYNRIGNRSLPVPYQRTSPNVPNNFRQNPHPTAPRRIELNDNLSNQRGNTGNAGNMGNRVDNQQLVDIESRLEEIRSAFDKIEQYSDVNRQKRQDHVNRQLMQELAQNREELAQLEEEQRSLQNMTEQYRPKAINRFSDYHSVLAEQGTPRNERHCSLEQINPEIDTATVILEHNSEDSPSSRVARIERLLVQALSKIDNHEKEIDDLKDAARVRPPSNPLLHACTSTPGPRRAPKRQTVDFGQFMDKKRGQKSDSEMAQVYSLCETAIEAHKDNSAFLVSVLALIATANTNDLRRKIVKAVEHVLEDDESESIGSVSDDDDEQMSEQTKQFITEDLASLVKEIVQQVFHRLVAQPDEGRILKSQELDDILATILSCSGVMGLKARFWKQFIESIRDPMLRFVGKPVEREQMLLELSEILFNEIHYIRTVLSGKPFTIRMENVKPGDVDRHVSYDAGRDQDDQKNIELSVAEVQALTCYGSGEDEESDGGSIDEKNENDLKNPETAINEPTKEDRSDSSSPVVVPVETEKEEFKHEAN